MAESCSGNTLRLAILANPVVKENILKAASLGRQNTHKPEAQARRAETQRRHNAGEFGRTGQLSCRSTAPLLCFRATRFRQVAKGLTIAAPTLRLDHSENLVQVVWHSPTRYGNYLRNPENEPLPILSPVDAASKNSNELYFGWPPMPEQLTQLLSIGLR